MDSMQANSSEAGASGGLWPWLKAHAGLVLGIFATLLTMLAVWGALFQKPHFNAYRTAPPLLSLDYLGYPVEQNAFRRLPVIGSYLNDVFALPGGKHIWAVGENGLILHSGDGGFTWQQQFVTTGKEKPKPQIRSSFSLLSEAWAGMPESNNIPANAAQQSQSQRTDNRTSNDTVQTPSATSQNSAVSQSREPPVMPETRELAPPSNLTIQQEAPNKSSFSDNANDRMPNAAATKTAKPSAVPKTKKALQLPKPAVQPVKSKKTPTAAGQNAAAKKSPETAVKSEIVELRQSADQPVQPSVSKGTSFPENLKSVFFVDAEQGWAVGAKGTIIATQDGGLSWQAQSSGTAEGLNGVTFTDAEHGWVVGNYGTIVATQDGGLSWQTQSSGTAESFNGVTFTDTKHGWVVGNYGTIVATQDGGLSWQTQSSGTGRSLNGVTFTDAKHGWVVGWEGMIVATQDGGLSWQAQNSGTGERLYGVSFVDAEHGWAVGNRGTFVATQDGGLSWQAQSGGTGNDFSGVSFSDAGHGWAVGINGSIIATQDGGNSWQAQSSGFGDSLVSVSFADAGHGGAMGGGGIIVATQDGGLNWQTQSSGTDSSLLGVSFADAKHGWAVGDFGTIIATQDGSLSWQTRSRGTKTSLYSVSFADINHGWAVGNWGTIVATQDGGLSWQTQSSGTVESFNGVTFTDTKHGWVVGNYGTIVATQDGGLSWQTQISGTARSLYGVTFTDAKHGWVVGWVGIIVATQDGGLNWQTQNIGTGIPLYGVAFVDALHGWAVGDHGTIVTTQDGGETWQDIVYRRFPAPWFYAAMLAAIMLYGRAWVLVAKQGETSTPRAGIANRVVTDKPAGPGSPDFLGARRIGLELTRFLVNRNTQPPVTIAITGEWGSGKSSIMNYLFAGLKREGLSPVWFNAWHHREEQNVLASILANVHQQAIKPWWTLSGFWFRLRLLWKRNWLIKSGLLLMAFSTTLLFSWLYYSPNKWEETKDYALYLMHIEKPVMLGEKGFRTLCPVVSNAGEDCLATTNTGKAVIEDAVNTGNTAQTANATGKIRQPAIQSEKKSPAPTKSNNKPESGTAGKATQSGASNEAKAKGVFNPEQCGQLQCLVAPVFTYRSSLQCGAGKSNPCYETSGDLLEAVERQLNIELTTEAEASVLKEVEHLHPNPPVQAPSALVKWVTGLAALLGLLTVNGMALLGLAPMGVFQGLLNKSGVMLQPSEAVGTRLLFERHFKLVTELLGQRRLVLFIDDLDRCDREYTRKVLEITNFLASSGDLFMVLGMAPRYVLANVTLSFQDMAKAVHEAEMLNGENPDGDADKDAGQSWFARHYLQKLIHIEVPVPKAKTEQVLAILKAEQGELDKTEELEKKLDSLLAISGKLLRLVLIVGALGGGAYWGFSLGQPQQDVPVIQEAAQKVTTSGEGSKPVDKGIEKPVKPDPKEPSKPEELFRPGYTSENFAEWPVWTVLLLTVGFIGCGLGLYYLMKHLEIIRDKNWLSWLEPLLHRLKVKLLGPELRDDSLSFIDALDIWYKLIAITDPSPRNLKAFLNRLRYFASRYSGAVDSQREAQLVALATMHYAFDEEMDEAIALMQAYETNAQQSRVLSSHLREDPRWEELDAALKAHMEKFSAFPSLEDREFFKYLCEDIRIHKRD